MNLFFTEGLPDNFALRGKIIMTGLRPMNLWFIYRNDWIR
jgi:hypothetical protein